MGAIDKTLTAPETLLLRNEGRSEYRGILENSQMVSSQIDDVNTH